MKRILIRELQDHIGEDVLLSGWAQTVRSHGKIAFIEVSDRSGTIQVGAFKPETAADASNLHSQDIVKVTGLVKKREERYINKNIPFGDLEVEATSIEKISNPEVLPFDMGGKDLHLELPTLLDYRPLTLRHPTQRVIFKVQEAVADAFRKAAKELDCTEIFVPTIASGATEGGSEVFPISYYEHNAFLIQSPQLYKQMMVGVFERVYTISHAYRAEPSVTTRHLAEVVQLDCEIGFIESFDELLDALETVGKNMIQNAAVASEDVLKQLNVPMPKIPQKVPRLKLREAQELIFKRTNRDVRKEKDLSPEDEQEIASWALSEYESDLVIITHYPTSKRAFYTYPDPEEPEFSLSYDVLFRGIEIASGSKRIHEYEQLVEMMKKRGIDVNQFGLYLQAFRYGMPEHGGFSYGLERVTMKLLGLRNVREASLFPRDMERVDERFSILTKKDQ